MEKVSVIVPCYNLENLIKKCINSIMKQTYRNLEIVIVNDGSTDNSGIICSKLKNSDKRIILINNESAGGVEKARLTGISNSTGDYIMFVDGDDYIAHNAVEKLLKRIRENNCDIVIGNSVQVIGKHLCIKKKRKSKIYDKYICQPELFEEYFISYFGINKLPVNIWGNLYKSNIIKKYLPPVRNVNHAEDLLFNMFIFPNIQSVSIISDIIYYYRYGGMTTKMNYHLFSTACKVYQYKIETIKKYNYEKAYIYVAIELKNFLNSFIKSLFVNTNLSREEIENLVLKEIDNSNFNDAISKIRYSQYNNREIELIDNRNVKEYINNVFPNISLIVLKQKVKKTVFSIINIIC